MRVQAIVALTLIPVALLAAVAIQPCSVGEPTATASDSGYTGAWDPVSCWDCHYTADVLAATAWGYLVGIVVGLIGIGRRRFYQLNPAQSSIISV